MEGVIWAHDYVVGTVVLTHNPIPNPRSRGGGNRRKSMKNISLTLSLIILMFSNNFTMGTIHAESSNKNEAAELNGQLIRLIETIQEHYVDADKTSYERLYHGAMKGVLQSLDNQCQLLLPEPVSDSSINRRGEFGGIGVEITIRDGLLTIISPIVDTPGYKAGLLAGDKIIEIDGESTKDFSLMDAVKKLRGTPGSKVTLTVMRSDGEEIIKVPVTREVIKISNIKDARIINDDIGYIRIIQFNQAVVQELRDAIEKLKKKGMKGLVLDLRYNPGGLLTPAVQVSQMFLNPGDLIVITEGRNQADQKKYFAESNDNYPDLPLAILINGGSAGSSEIVAGALQDHNRAVIVGERSLGKGSVTSVLPLRDGAAFRLTTALFYTPNGRVIHGNGIIPGIPISIPPDELKKLLLLRCQSPDEKSETEVVDVQINKAIEVLKNPIEPQ